MKKISKVLMIISLLMTMALNIGQVKAKTNNLVRNWDFESENNEGWEQNKVGHVIDGVSYGDGNKAGVVPSDCADGYVGQYIYNLKPNTTYKITVQAKVDTDGAKAILATRVFDNNPWEYEGKPEKDQILKEMAVTSTNWQEYSYEFNTALNTNKVFVSLVKWAGVSDSNYEAVKKCNAYIDNVIIEEVNSIEVPEEDYNLVWEDQFNGEKLDLDKWRYETGYVRNKELQEYVDSEENVYLENGDLVLKATKKDEPVTVTVDGQDHKMYYNSGSIESFGHQDVLYGKIEMRAKLTNGKGFWPAFWTLGSEWTSEGQLGEGTAWPECGEIDIMEAPVQSPDGVNKTTWATIHYQKNGSYQKMGGEYKFSEDLADDYHIYGINWTPEKIEWYFDDIVFYTADISDIENFQKPHFVKLNLAVGGSWPGNTIDESKLPAEYRIDYVTYSQTEEQKAAADAFYANAPQISGVKDIKVLKGTPILQENGESGLDLLDGVQAVDKNGKKLTVGVSTLPSTFDTNTVGETMLVYTAKDDSGVYGRTYATLTVVDLPVKDELKKLIEDVELLNADDYTPNTWSKLQNDLTKAKQVLEDNSVWQEDVDSMVKTLEASIGSLVKRADITKLELEINNIEKLDSQKYTAETWDNLASVLVDAKAVAADKNVTQTQVDDILSRLVDAKGQLKLKEDGSVSVSWTNLTPSQQKETTNKVVKTSDESPIGMLMTTLLLSSSMLYVLKKRKNNC
ncbi:hypothetical protein B5E92_04820 [Erysipelatoclostridium sp. An15]|uniref:family 16 glycosylhydrolase n=1 Tax=Erysipelatoclostridium sp. An15 TaxID=1965566 RepID=UPI000B376CF9|nr:family 16 glycosylhydrolase [Erysipelatoclostridium sp. An15]OUQ08201.1 hypothetical protein B5E92_04820 [Erysipelatoclostridium sp. An15]